MHAQRSYETAKERKWIKADEPKRIEYGSPLQDDTLTFRKLEESCSTNATLGMHTSSGDWDSPNAIDGRIPGHQEGRGSLHSIPNSNDASVRPLPPPIVAMGNPQTDRFLASLGLDHKVTIPYRIVTATGGDRAAMPGDAVEDENEIDLDEVSHDEKIEADQHEIAIDSGEEVGDEFSESVPEETKKQRVEE